MTWIDTVQWLRMQRIPAVLITVTEVRGHAPRRAGTKMVVSPNEVFETIGGGVVTFRTGFLVLKN